MATFTTLPPELQLMMLENLAERNVDDLYSLILASKTHQEVFNARWLPVLRKAITTVLPTAPELVGSALQAHCSDGEMRLTRDIAGGDEINAWSVPPKHDIWSLSYARDKVKALEFLVWWSRAIEEMQEELFMACISHKTPFLRAFMRRDPADEEIIKFKLFHYTPVDVKEAVWLQEMMRLLTQNRDSGDLRCWYERWLCENGFADTPGIEGCLQSLIREAKRGGTCCAADRARLRESEVYFGYLKRVEEKYPHARDLGRRIQKILLAYHVEAKYPRRTFPPENYLPNQFSEFHELAKVWRWARTKRGEKGALE